MTWGEPELNLMKTTLLWGLFGLCGSVLGQMGLPAVVSSNSPDFGASPGTWGHLQFSRPYGVKGILLDEWVGLSLTQPVNGEVMNTDRIGWMPFSSDETIWAQIHPELTAPSDTAAPSMLVNYRQGDGALKDFSLWYHNSLGKSTRYGWVSQLRSHPRYVGVTKYAEQNHRIQLTSELDEQLVLAEISYSHQVNPLYISELDTNTLIWNYLDDQVISSDRWEGYFRWENFDSSQVGSELFAQVQGGVWNWAEGKFNSYNSLAYIAHNFKMGNWSPLGLKAGYVSKQLGGHLSTRHFLEMNLPQIGLGGLTADFGLKNLGVWRFLPNVDVKLLKGPLQIGYTTRHIVDDPTWKSELKTALIHDVQTSLNFSNVGFMAGAWQGSKMDEPISGYQSEIWANLPWMMGFKLGVSVLEQTPDWVWSKKELFWEINQDFILFDQALFGHLKIWGRHLDHPQTGFLDPNSITVIPATSPGSEDVLHLLNYTIQAQISTLIIGFTDANILQDPLWSNYLDVPWESEYTLMTNQFPESRFRYFSMIWVFDN